MYAGFFDVLPHATHHRALSGGNQVDVHFNRVLEELIDEQRLRAALFARRVDRELHVSFELLIGPTRHHGTAAEHVGGAHEQWEADALRELLRFLYALGDAGLWPAQ